MCVCVKGGHNDRNALVHSCCDFVLSSLFSLLGDFDRIGLQRGWGWVEVEVGVASVSSSHISLNPSEECWK